METTTTESRQVIRASLRNENFIRMGPAEKHNGNPLRRERRSMSRAFAAGAWKNRKKALDK